MLANFHVWGIMFLLRAVLNILVRNASPRGPMCFRCLIFNLSGPCELLFLLCFIASWTWEVVSVMLYTCMLCVALLMCLFVLCVACLTVFVNCLVKQFAMCVGVVAILLLNVMDVFSVCGGALLDRPCVVFQRVCVLCLWSERVVCCCTKCENVTHCIRALNHFAVQHTHSQLQVPVDTTAISSITLCPETTRNEATCFQRTCKNCGVDKLSDHFAELTANHEECIVIYRSNYHDYR